MYNDIAKFCVSFKNFNIDLQPLRAAVNKLQVKWAQTQAESRDRHRQRLETGNRVGNEEDNNNIEDE